MRHTSCDHHFHHRCLSRWLVAAPSPNCLNCRIPLSNASSGQYTYRAQPLCEDLPILLATGMSAQLLDTIVFLFKARRIHVRILVVAIIRSSNEPADPHSLVAQAGQLWGGRILREPGEIAPLGSEVRIQHGTGTYNSSLLGLSAVIGPSYPDPPLPLSL